MPSFDSQKTYALFNQPANRKLIFEIENSGAKILLFPAVETRAVFLPFEAENLLKNLCEFDWIIFPDVFAVEYFLLALEKLEIDFYELDALRVCALSETIADRLRYSQIHADVISNSVRTEKVLQALKNYEPDFVEYNFLSPKEKYSFLEISDLLIKSGAKVTELPVYLADSDQITDLPRLKALLKGGAIDEFIFSSPADAVNFALLFQTDDLSFFLSETTISAANSLTVSSLREYGLTRAILRK